MNLQALLGNMPKTKFVAEYFHRLPYSVASGARPVCELGTWQVLGEILAQDNVDVMVVRDGTPFAGPDPRSLDAARKLSDEGHTILVRHAEKQHDGLQSLAAAFAEDFHAPVNIHLYATPPGRHGFSWHYDAEDVFIMQTRGNKEYSLRKNTVHPWPLVETIPQDMGYPSEIMPLMRVLLAAGDWLYIPFGYWHKAEACDGDETAISLALGVMSPAAMDVYDSLRARLLESMLWRQRLPVRGAATPFSEEQLVQQYRELLSQLADDLARSLQDDRFVRELLKTSVD